MTVIILSVLGVVLFIVGVVFAVRAYLSLPSADSFVPRSEYELLQKTLNVAKESEARAQGSLFTVKKEAEETKRELAMTKSSEESLRKDLERIRKDWEEFKGGNENQLSEALVRLENLTNENEYLTKRLSELEAKLIDQAEGSLEIIKDLKAQNEELKSKGQEPPSV